MFTIRRTDLSDLEALVRLRIALLREIGHITARTTEDELAALIEAHRQYFRDNLATGKYVGFAAVAQGRIVGNGGLVFLERPPYNGNLAGSEAYLMNMYTDPEWRQKGVAEGIVNRILPFAKEAGAKRIWLHSEPKAKRIYERAGFVPKSSEMEVIF
jgi:GNAT superfamily N-acetyltransferase